jgi:membrane protease YdiL (CAAX protease family)
MPWMSQVAAIKSMSSVWNPRELAMYFALAYAISLALWLPALVGKSVSHLYLSVGTFGPTLAALTTHQIFAGNWRWPALLQILTLFGPNLLGGPLGEEPGWRGYALPRLQRRFDPLISSLILGFLWANWHLPLILAHVYNVTWWQFVPLTLAASVFLSFGFNRSKGSTLCAIVVHGIYNVGTGIILNDFIGKATLRSNTVQHNILWMAYAGVAALLSILTKGRLGAGDKR